MTQSLFQPTQRAFVKHILVLFATVLILIPEVYAQDDKLIDGIKFRYGTRFTTYEFELDNRNVASKHGGINTEIDKYTGWAGKSKFPIIITFPETASRWTFRQPYYDFVINDKINDIPPDHRPGYETQLKRSDSKSVNLVQIPERRVYLKEKFLPKFLSSSQISNLPSDWAISYDLEHTAITLGYMWGVFYPIGEMHRLFKTAFGLGIGIVDTKIKINLCDMYTLTANYKTNDEGTKKLEPPHEGKCINPNLLKSLSYVEPTLSWGIYLSLWERVSKDSVWTILTADVTSNETNYRDESVEATDGGKARFRSTLGGIDIISYTYRF